MDFQQQVSKVSPQPQQTRTRRISDQIGTTIKFASGTETTDKKMSAADRGRAVAAEKVRKQNERLAAVVDPEEAAKAAAERAHGVGRHGTLRRIARRPPGRERLHCGGVSEQRSPGVDKRVATLCRGAALSVPTELDSL